jgi:hypothetical protein
MAAMGDACTATDPIALVQCLQSQKENQDIADCVSEGNAMAADLDQRIATMQRDWNPTGYYSPDQIRKIVGETVRLISSCADKVRDAPAPRESFYLIKNEADEIARKAQEGIKFLDAASEAERQGIGAVDAPGLKHWVIFSLQAGSNALVAAGALACNKPWFLTALQYYQAGFDAVWGVAKQIVGVVINIGDAILHVPDAVSELWTFVKWGALLGVAGYAFVAISKKKKAIDGAST